MYLKKIAKRISALLLYILLFCLLALYSDEYLMETGEGLLVSIWGTTFQSFDGTCIWWISLRLVAWLLIYAHMLRLEGGFSIYLFLRQKSYGRVFLHTYFGCVVRSVCYFCGGTVVMALFYSLTMPGMGFASLMLQDGLPLIVAEEIFEALSFCLLAFLVRCITKKAEIGFLVALGVKLSLNILLHIGRPSFWAQLIAVLVLSCAVFALAFRDFTEKYVDM